MVNLSSEKSISIIVTNYFKRKGWNLKNNTNKHGVDIELMHTKWNKTWFIEVKRKYNNKNKKSTTYNSVATAIGQIIYRMKRPNSSFYGIAVPDIKIYKDELNKITPTVRTKLKLNIFLINHCGQVRKITPSKHIQ